ncbi:MAG: metallophosphoesterase [Eubacteriales bacterium]|nr:metallophosphoesterase [Eubacteriales bacterium]
MLLILFCYWQNNGLVITEYAYWDAKVSSELEGFRILQISDLHSKNFRGRLIEKIEEQKPDIIVITGDLIDSYDRDIDTASKLITAILPIAPVYFVPGNHESNNSKLYAELVAFLASSGVTVLEDSSCKIREKGLNIIGMADPAFMDAVFYDEGMIMTAMKQAADTNVEEHMFNLLLAHRPEYFDLYSQSNVDLVFCGHAHGGQVRIPFVGGLVAPGQGLFPEYTSGIHKKNDTSMVISRGLGNSILPLRIFNRPEIVVVTLRGQGTD